MRTTLSVALVIAAAFTAGLNAAGTLKHGATCGPTVKETCGRGLYCAGTICLADGSKPGRFGDFCGTKGAFNCDARRGLVCSNKDDAARDRGGYCLADGSVPGKKGYPCGSKGAYNCGPGLKCQLRLPGAMDAGGVCQPA